MFESELERAGRHVREGEARLARQREVLAYLENQGFPTEHAEMLVVNFEIALGTYRMSLARIGARCAGGRA
jgi:hypothetical protein